MESIEGAVDAGAVPSESLGRDDQDGREASYATKTGEPGLTRRYRCPQDGPRKFVGSDL